MFEQEKYPKETILSDGSKIIIRPLTDQDFENYFNFFQNLPEDIRRYLKVDVTRREIVKRRMHDDDIFQYHRLIALDKNKIIGEATLSREIHNWKRHLGEIRVLLSPDYQKKGLGATLIKELYPMANHLGIDILYANILEEQQGALHIFSKLGFVQKIVKRDHVKDFQGNKHDLIVMYCNLSRAIPKNEDYYISEDLFTGKKYPKEVELNDGRRVTIRPMAESDFESSFQFFQELPEDIRRYLKVDVSQKEVVKRRMRQDDVRQHHRLIALDQDKIIADATIYREAHSWKNHLGEIRVIIHPDYQRQGLGSILIHEIYVMANLLGIEILYANILDIQKGALEIFKKLGFKQEMIKRGHVKDLKGEKHDLIVMSCNLAELWQQWEMLLLDMDTGRG